MARKSYVQINGVLYDKSQPLPPEAQQGSRQPGIGFIPDLPDFVSPIDGKVVSGRAGLRDHCARHNVVPTQELKGLPNKLSVQEYLPDRRAIRETIARQLYK